MKIKRKKYKGYEIYYYEDKFLNISKDIINENFQIIKIYKDTVRNYVAKISLKNEEKFYLKKVITNIKIYLDTIDIRRKN